MSRVLGGEHNWPGKRLLLLCQHCLGTFAALRACLESGPLMDYPVTITITVAPRP